MVKKMLKKKGPLLVDAWLGGILADKNPDVLRILLVTQNGERFKRFAKREKVSVEEAKKEVLSRDKNWFGKVSVIHNRTDFFDREYYNLIINTTELTLDQILQKVLSVLRHD